MALLALLIPGIIIDLIFIVFIKKLTKEEIKNMPKDGYNI